MYEEAFFHLLAPMQNRHARGPWRCGRMRGQLRCQRQSRSQNQIRTCLCPTGGGGRGGAIGAAFAAWQKLGGERCFVMNHAFWGPHFSTEEIQRALAAGNRKLRQAIVLLYSRMKKHCSHARRNCRRKGVVGWFQGRMEWGPRALGNRSNSWPIPAGPISKSFSMPRLSGEKSFRPFAPSVLDWAVQEWFEDSDPVPFMMQVYPIRDEKRAKFRR